MNILLRDPRASLASSFRSDKYSSRPQISKISIFTIPESIIYSTYVTIAA